MKSEFAILGDCSGQTYVELLEFVAERSSLFYLVDQQNIPISESAFLRSASTFIHETSSSSEWPGTKLLGFPGELPRQASIHYFAINPESIRLLSQTTDCLYGWLSSEQPCLPEDLGFIRADGTVVLATVSHEHIAWLELEESECADFVALAKQLRLKIDRVEPKIR